MYDGKEQSAHEMCKNHTARSEKDFYRVCPSKLSKRELEDLYFALVENNVELKKTVNGQREQLKVLSTKLQRMTAHKPLTRDQKECCCNCRAVMNEQKEIIADLKKSNDRLTERIRLLNMRLCSAKQFLKKGPQFGSKCTKCNASISVKNSSTSALSMKANEDNLRLSTTSCQYPDDIAQPSSPTAEIPSIREQPAKGSCDQNKCRTLMDEMKQKIADLQQELSTTHTDYSMRIIRLEEEMSHLQKENVRVVGESSSSGHKIEQHKGEISDLLHRLRVCEAQCEELEVQLRVEKSRGAELELRGRAAEAARDVAAAVERRRGTLHMKREEQAKQMQLPESNISLPNVDDSSMYHCQFQLIVPNNSASSQTDRGQEISTDKLTRMSDDSGYTEAHTNHDSTQVSPKKEDIVNQIADLQAQLNSLKQSIDEHAPKAREVDDDELLTTLETKRKSYCEKTPTTRKYDGTLDCQPPSPRDDDYLIRTKRLNSSKSSHEWYTEFEKSDAESTVDENRPSLVSSIKDKSRRSTRYVDKHDFEYPNFTQNDIIDKEVTISKNDDEKDGAKNISKKRDEENTEIVNNDETVGAVGSSTDNFNFSKETIKRVNGKSICASIEKSNSTFDIKMAGSCHQPVCESFRDINDGLTKVREEIEIEFLEKDRGLESDVGKTVNGNKYVSTGVDPIAIYSEPTRNELKDTGVGTEEEIHQMPPGNLDICEQSIRVCTCPISPRRGVAMFRSCSGTLRFTTTASNGRFRRCSCGDNELTRAASIDRELPAPYKTSSPRRTSTPVSAISPATRCGISSLTDILSEREVSNVSPGEDKGTCTESEPTPRSTTDYGSLSEGELPVYSRRQSIGETQSPDVDVTNMRRNTSTSEKMEETLLAISDELSRCRRLLQAHTSPESTKVGSLEEAAGAGLPLRACAAAPRLRGAGPAAMLTLHVGSVILSDQAVISSRNKSLALKWQFYDQPVTLTHQLAGRLMHFDFSVEYDIRLTEHFLEYLKQEEMPITVCEWEKRELPFASCALPLRDTLLHTNRRVDMSLALKKASYDSENIYDIMNTKKWRRASALKQTEGCRKKSVTILPKPPRQPTIEDMGKLSDEKSQTLHITILWLALNEECKAMTDPKVKRLYVAYSFLGKCGADMETPSSLPKPRNFMDKCHFNFRKSFIINDCDVAVISHMARSRQDSTSSVDPKDCIVFSIISEPPEDPLGLDTCEDIGYAYLYLGDAVRGEGGVYSEVLAVRGACADGRGRVCGRLAVRLDGLAILRARLLRAHDV